MNKMLNSTKYTLCKVSTRNINSQQKEFSRRQLHLLPFFQEAEVPIPESYSVTDSERYI